MIDDPTTPDDDEDDDGYWIKWAHDLRDEIQRLTLIDNPTGHEEHRLRLLLQQLEAYEEATSD